MKLYFDGESEMYHPATGVNLIPGEYDYPDEKTADLLAAGLRKTKPAAPEAPTHRKTRS